MALPVDASYALFGAESLLKRLQALQQEVEGVRRAEDIEYVHRMRVASRRLRAAMAVFEPTLPKRRYVDWLRAIKRVTRSLGAARDTDVQIDWLLKAEERLPDPRDRYGIDRLILRLRQRREHLQEGVLDTLDRIESSGVLEDLSHWLRQSIVEARLRAVSTESPLIVAQACTHIAVRLEEMLAYEGYVSRPEHIEELHAMRITAKRLRYTMELFAPVFDDALKSEINVVKDVQEALGELHDCDVWLQTLPEFLESERQRMIEYCGDAKGMKRVARGIETLIEVRRADRQELYSAFVALWKQTVRDSVWDNLRQRLRDTMPADGPASLVEE